VRGDTELCVVDVAHECVAAMSTLAGARSPCTTPLASRKRSARAVARSQLSRSASDGGAAALPRDASHDGEPVSCPRVGDAALLALHGGASGAGVPGPGAIAAHRLSSASRDEA
jgi:hypothetical protein